ncbi:MAG: CBS domain-containing protein [Cyanobacteria bacterium REEB67]|nr:CBS domain-containing protein [Cyanobacteria bacterium REEB67]
MEIALSHSNMDFDSLSAQYALTKLFPACRMVLGYPLTGNVRNFLTLNRSYLPIVQAKHLDLAKVSRFFLVDCQHLERLDEASRRLVISGYEQAKGLSGRAQLTRPITVFDHHTVDPQGLIGQATVDSVFEKTGAATTILVDRIIKAEVPLSPFDATVLAIGIFEDTGCLTFSGTTALDAHCIAFLIGKGADLSVVREYIRPQLEQKQIDLFEKLLNHTEIVEIHGHRFLLAVSEHSEYIEGLATITRQLLDLNNAEGAFTLAHMRDRVHIVGRCNPKVLDLRRVMQEFGGDGHPGAASAVVKGGQTRELVERLKETIGRHVVHQPQARQLMESPVRTVRPDISMDEAGRIMLRYGIDGLIVAEGDDLLGVVSRRDIDQSTHHRLGHAKVSGFMSKPVLTIALETPLNQIQQIMVAEDIGRLPVLDERKQLVGLVTRQAVLNSLFGVDYAKEKKATVESLPAAHSMENENLSGRMRKMDEHTVWLAEEIGRISLERDMVAYAVGGFVRDLLLKRPTFDLDFVIEGSAIALAEQLVLRHPQKFKLMATHERFQTATLMYFTDSAQRTHRDVDLSTARIEIYEKPAALPDVEPSKIEHDLLRRDFTINALAVCLNPDHFGELVDHFNGLGDLELKVMRILHPFSFIEDPTRIVRAARFAGRLGFQLETKTLEQAKRALAMGIFDDLGGVRMKEELRLILQAPTRLKSLNILGELSGKLCYLDSQLHYCDVTRKAIRRAERLLERYPIEEDWIVYLGALLSELPIERVPGVLERLQLTNKQKQIIESGLDLHRQMPLSLSSMKRSEIYDLMHGLPREALAIAAAIAVVGSDLRRAIKTYLEELADTKLDISGGDLIARGHKSGPALGDALRHVLAARLDKDVATRDEQLELAGQYLTKN